VRSARLTAASVTRHALQGFLDCATQPAQFMPPIERRTARAFVFMAAIVALRRVVSRYQRQTTWLLPGLRIRLAASGWPFCHSAKQLSRRNTAHSPIPPGCGPRTAESPSGKLHRPPAFRQIFRFIEHDQILHAWINSMLAGVQYRQMQVPPQNTSPMSSLPPLLAALQQPATYAHPCREIVHLETHISHVFLPAITPTS